jgi:hypothetical protein
MASSIPCPPGSGREYCIGDSVMMNWKHINEAPIHRALQWEWGFKHILMMKIVG